MDLLWQSPIVWGNKSQKVWAAIERLNVMSLSHERYLIHLLVQVAVSDVGAHHCAVVTVPLSVVS